MSFKLTNGQEKCIDEILTTINSKGFDQENRFHTLIGPAGSGKTTVVNYIVDKIPRYKTVCIAAPTHKAVKVIRRMIQELNLGTDRTGGIDNRTIHSTLGLMMKQVEGDEVLVKEPFCEEKVFDVLIIDESSMLGDEILMYILDAMSAKIIFVGDKAQISPVGSAPGEVSKVFTDVSNISELTEVVRQAEDNPIIKLATAFRLCQEDEYSDFPQITTDLDENGNGIMATNRHEWLERLVNMYKTDMFRKDPDYCRCIAYTSHQVDVINNYIRQKLFGVNVEEWRVGEIIVAQEMGGGEGEMGWKNAEEMRILQVEDYWCNKFEVDCWLIKMDSLTDNEIHTCKIVKKGYMAKYNERLQIIAGKARSDSANSRMHWKKFWALKKAFSEFKHIYAMTAHKSQGSTFDYTFVYTPDFIRFGATMEIKQLLYTATTRSRFRTEFAM